MDDPWGSPWASSEPTSKHNPPAPSPPKNLLSPPPKAFFGSTSNLQSQSPWADNDGFGDWAGAEHTDVATNALDWGVWAEPSSQNSQPSPRTDELGKRGSIAWPSSAATSPGLRPLPRSRASSVFRHHSPDPWATELSLHNEIHDAPTTPSPSNIQGISAGDSQREIIEARLPSTREQDIAEISELGVGDAESRQDDGNTAKNEPKIWEPEPKDEKESSNPDADIVPKVEVHDPPSRPSSTFSRDSSGAVERQDSPITSIDEDPKSRLQATPRKASGKVQELVGMYDDLAKVAIDESPASTRLEPSRSRSRGRSPSQAKSTEREEDADFGDFEDAGSADDEPATDIEDSTTSSRRSSTPKAPPKETLDQDHTREPTEYQHTPSVIFSAPTQQLIEKYGPMRFNVDLKSIDKLFPILAQSTNGDAEETDIGEIPDRVIGDNFSTISERKTWYRISRFGSMRKHDSGDEDNYHRVEWSNSHLHDDTIKIVRRWMEEDSIAGRVTLGAAKRTSVFNWDSSAAPVDLGKVFSRKVSNIHSRNSSIPPQQSLEGPVHSTIGSPVTQSIKSPIEPPDAAPIASFGWSSSKDFTTKPIPSQNQQSEHARSASQSTQANTKIEPDSMYTPAQPPPQPIQTEVTIEDDDDWGEMVSSPQVETQPNPNLETQSFNITSTPVDATSNPGEEIGGASQSNGPVPKPSVSIPQSNQAPKQVVNHIGSSAKTQQTDPWPLADFSIFENLSARPPKLPKQDPWPLGDFSVFESPTSESVPKSISHPISKPRDNDHARASTDTADARPPLKAVLGPIQKQDSVGDQDEIVRGIIQNLPDLLYMLR
ncbi:hypothetical protein GGR53DRAFT_27408 [Hypoxylon sp. FL1150]|nr:hypothetical protein GGR53DRAFT_27408 [Hypoxylon sp. FL1150]